MEEQEEKKVNIDFNLNTYEWSYHEWFIFEVIASVILEIIPLRFFLILQLALRWISYYWEHPVLFAIQIQLDLPAPYRLPFLIHAAVCDSNKILFLPDRGIIRVFKE